MINGRYDFTAPFLTSQRPLFRCSVEAGPTRSTSSSTAATSPWPDVVRETLDWLDKYMGPVATR